MPDLPSGTVTFLFTDIEGSTTRWERNRVAMATAVERHLSLLRDAIEAHGGVHFKTVGDAVQAAFPKAPQAVAAALDGQRALLAEVWGTADPLRVRIALHAGEAEPRHGDYLAAPLNRLSRLLAAAHGGQILLTHTVQQLSRGALPAGIELRDLGEHRLRDLLEPERVFQLVHPNLPVDFPPLKTLDARPNNLPIQPTPFLGREREVREVVDRLSRPELRLLTLTGPGGTGKTRLALQAAAEVLEDFADGVFFVPLTALADPGLVPAAITTALGLREEAGQSLADRLRDFMATKNILLVLDNFEHLIEGAPGVGELLGSSPGMKVLATSREPLRLRAEREYPVPPLGLPQRDSSLTPEQLSQSEAVRLFVERAQAVQPDFALNNENAPAVAEICHRLDGLPLAIELAATRVRLLPPEALLARLEQRLPLLTGGARDAPVRQRTLRDTIAWSYDLLSRHEQVLFRHLSVFVGGWTLEAAEAVTIPDGQLVVLEGLGSLVERSLVRRVNSSSGEPRFSMLETIREYGIEQLSASGDEDQTRERHAAWVLRLAERAEPELFRTDQHTWVMRLDIERPNIRSALAWFAQIGDAERAQKLAGILTALGWMSGHLREGVDWLRRALAIPGETSIAVRSWALTGIGTLLWFLGDIDAARDYLQQSLTVSRDGEYALGLAHAQRMLAMTAWTQGDLEQAMLIGEEALGRLREVGHPEYLAIALGDMGTVALLNGNIEKGQTWSQESLALSRALGNRWYIANHLSDLGTVAYGRGDLRKAAADYAESVRLLREVGDTWYIASPLAGLASIAVSHGHAEVAARLLGTATALREASGATVWPWERERDEQTLMAVQDELGEEGCAQALTAGRAAPLEQAVDEATAALRELGKGSRVSEIS